jgi:DNA-binding beta-propeller fold protein YncE
MIYVSPNLKLIVTTNVSSGTVSIIEKIDVSVAGQGRPLDLPGGDWNETAVKVGNGSEGFDVSPDGKRSGLPTLGMGLSPSSTLRLSGSTQTLAADIGGANRLKFTPDGELALISALRGSDLTVIDTATRKTVQRIAVGQGAAGIVMPPDGARAFVACSPDNYVVVIDQHSMIVVGRIEVGQDLDRLAWATRSGT